MDVVACCHQGSERTALTTPTGTNLIASSAAAMEAKEWFWYASGEGPEARVVDEQLRREQERDADQGAAAAVLYCPLPCCWDAVDFLSQRCTWYLLWFGTLVVVTCWSKMVE